MLWGRFGTLPFHGLMCNLSPFLNVNFFYLPITLSPCLVSLVTAPFPLQTCHQLSHLCDTLTDRSLTRARTPISTSHTPNCPPPTPPLPRPGPALSSSGYSLRVRSLGAGLVLCPLQSLILWRCSESICRIKPNSFPLLRSLQLKTVFSSLEKFLRTYKLSLFPFPFSPISSTNTYWAPNICQKHMIMYLYQ